MKVAIGITSFIAGWLLATGVVIALNVARLNIPAAFAETYSEYRAYAGAEILILTVGLGFAVYQVAGRRIFHWPRDERPRLERLPVWMRQPTSIGLFVAWVVAPFTLTYPVAIFMSWRYYQAWRAGQKLCPRCAERVKAAATMCRHCGLDFSLPPANAAGLAVVAG